MKRIILAAFAMITLMGAQAQRDEQLRKLRIAEMAVANLYVDSVNETKLVEDAIRGMLKELDPHSTYSTPRR